MRAQEFTKIPRTEDSVDDLEHDLKHPDSYKAIDHMMQTIARKYNISAKQLHDKFVEKHGVIPDNWSKEQLDELTFLGSECTKDCSGHRAGYALIKVLHCNKLVSNNNLCLCYPNTPL